MFGYMKAGSGLLDHLAQARGPHRPILRPRAQPTLALVLAL